MLANWKVYTSLDEFSSGETVDVARLNDIALWRRLYEGDLSSLYAVNESVYNGLNVVKRDAMQDMSLYHVMSHFYFDAVLSDLPAVSSEDEARQAWLDRFMWDVWEAFDAAVEDWSISDVGVMYTAEGELVRAVPSHNYFPVYAENDTDSVIGHCFFYPYASGDNKVEDRVRIVKYDVPTGTSYSQTFQYTAGGAIGPPVDTGASPRITGVFTFGAEKSFYPLVGDAVREINVREGAASLVLNKHTSPLLVAPAAAVAGNSQLLNPQGKSYTDQSPFQRTSDSISEGGGLISGKEDTDWAYLTYEAKLAENTAKIERLISYIHLVSGVPPQTFGVDIGKGESGVARERAMMSAVVKIGKLRASMSRMFPLMFDAMGAPEGDTSVIWTAGPLADKDAERSRAISEYAQGIITLDEVRAELGYDPMETDPDAEIREEEEQDA